MLSNAVTITTTRAPAYTTEEEPETSDEQKKEDDDIENPRKVAPLLTHVRVLTNLCFEKLIGGTELENCFE